MADCKAKGHGSVITIGGVQSNHARATSVAASYLGLESHLILRMSRNEVDKDPGLTGNLLVERMLGSTIHKVTKEEYVREGSVKLCEKLADQLTSSGGKEAPYIIPVGGSNSLGTWGYIEAIREIQEQSLATFATEAYFTDLAMACGSGGTTAGIALGARLSGMGQKVHAYAVCDDEDYFYTYTDGLIAGLYGPTVPKDSIPSSRSLLRVSMAKGTGYALSTREELEFVKKVAEATGVILDPVYSGKALFKMMCEIKASPSEWEGRKILFFHTGGLFGLWDKEDQLMEILNKEPKADRLLI